MQSMLVAMLAPMAVQAEVTASFEFKNETAFFTKDGQKIGEASGLLDDQSNHSAGDMFKFQNQMKAFINGDIGEESTWHAELQIIYDSEAIDTSDNGGLNYKAHENNTQNDFFRELYVDTSAGGWDWRLGKQQVVWGTADGIKLLDIINPTDFREVNQNGVADARIPIWMINGERYLENGGNIQVIVSEAEKNKIPGLNPSGDVGHPYKMLGVDSISGPVNGFYSITPRLSSVAGLFNTAAVTGGLGPFVPGGLTPFGGLTVDAFVNGGAGGSAAGLNTYVQGGADFTPGTGDPYENNFSTNLMDARSTNLADVSWNTSNPKSAFEYMSNATFATFNTFTGCVDLNGDGAACTAADLNGTDDAILGSGVEWKKDYPDDEANAGFRFRNTTDSGINYSFNYFYHYSANPEINLSWVDSNGNELDVQRARGTAGGGFVPDPSTDLTRDQAIAASQAGDTVTILVKDKANNYYGTFDPTLFNGTLGMGAPTLRFTETANRVHSLGGSFDMAVDSLDVPLILRGEFLYDKDEKQAVVDRYLLGIGDLTNALTMQDADYFKYVIGADVTVMTNLLVSTQFIQFINLDYVDQDATCTNGADCSRYTGDFSTLHLSNGMKQAEEYKEFVSIFLSKPIGEDQLGRWNNIFIWEEGGGYWNRLDAEYSVSDQFIVSAEWNNYWGDEDTTFGQLDKSSNVQVGFKYIFEDY